MNEETKMECVFKAFKALDDVTKIEKRINWNNDSDRDSQIGKRDSALFDLLWNTVAVQYRR